MSSGAFAFDLMHMIGWLMRNIEKRKIKYNENKKKKKYMYVTVGIVYCC